MAVDLYSPSITEQQLNNLQVAFGFQPSNNALSICRDILEGYTGSYYIFALDEDSTVLIMGEEMNYFAESGYCTGADVSAVQIDAVRSPDNSYSLTFTARPTTLETFAVYNNNRYVVYGSFEGLPHAIEGVNNYAYTLCLCAFGFIAGYFIQRIFRHVIG